MKKHISIVCLISIAVISTSALAKSEWKEERSEHFVVYYKKAPCCRDDSQGSLPSILSLKSPFGFLLLFFSRRRGRLGSTEREMGPMGGFAFLSRARPMVLWGQGA